MATERKLNKIYFFPVTWNGKELGRERARVAISYSSYDEVPEWLRERIAVLHLLEEHEESPVGMWKVDEWGSFYKDVDYFIVRQPGDPPWE